MPDGKEWGTRHFTNGNGPGLPADSSASLPEWSVEQNCAQFGFRRIQSGRVTGGPRPIAVDEPRIHVTILCGRGSVAEHLCGIPHRMCRRAIACCPSRLGAVSREAGRRCERAIKRAKVLRGGFPSRALFPLGVSVGGNHRMPDRSVFHCQQPRVRSAPLQCSNHRSNHCSNQRSEVGTPDFGLPLLPALGGKLRDAVLPPPSRGYVRWRGEQSQTPSRPERCRDSRFELEAAGR